MVLTNKRILLLLSATVPMETGFCHQISPLGTDNVHHRGIAAGYSDNPTNSGRSLVARLHASLSHINWCIFLLFGALF